jgi:hypothetical protein
MSDEKGKAAMKGEAIRLVALVDYQDGSVVSR